MKGTLRGMLAACALTALSLGVAVPAGNAYTAREAKCRHAMEASLRGLAKRALIGMETCHRLRMLCKFTEDRDCSDIAQLSGVSLSRVHRARANVITRVNKDCVGTPTQTACDYPCSLEVPIITNYTDLARCRSCLIESQAMHAMVGTYHTPPTECAVTPASRCQSQIGKALWEYTMAKTGQQQLCQYKEDKGGPAADCMAVENARTERAHNRLSWRISKCEPGALANSLHSCATNVMDEQACLEGWAEGLAGCLYHCGYEGYLP